MGQEEDLVIKLQTLDSALHTANPEDKLQYYPSLVQFHGEIISLLHWGILNFAAVAKILKKHDKLIPNAPLRTVFMNAIQQQPFYSTDLLERLAKKCEVLIDEVTPGHTGSSPLEAVDEAEAEAPPQLNLKKTLHAIRTWRDLGDNAHTPSTVLPYSKPIPCTMQSSTGKRVRSGDEIQADSKIARFSD